MVRSFCYILIFFWQGLTCTKAACTNNHASCATWISNGFCQSAFYTCEQKRSYCSQSCNIGGCSPQVSCAAIVAQSGSSSGSSGSSSCNDNHANCPTWITNGFCNMSFYTQQQKCQYCPKSCNICNLCSANQSASCNTSATPTKTTCPSKWTYFADTKSCYLNKKSPGISGDDAVADCVKENSKLASIHSDAENSFIYEFVRDAHYNTNDKETVIGMKYEANGVWVDGTPLDYTAWGPSEPAKDTTVKWACLETSVGATTDPGYLSKWRLRASTGTFKSYVCKMAAN